jgi:hypothetical protein
MFPGVGDEHANGCILCWSIHRWCLKMARLPGIVIPHVSRGNFFHMLTGWMSNYKYSVMLEISEKAFNNKSPDTCFSCVFDKIPCNIKNMFLICEDD